MLYGKAGFVIAAEMIEDVFLEMEATYVTAALKDNEEYQRCYEAANEIIKNNPRLSKVFENEEPASLTEADVKEMIKYLELEERQDTLWHIELYRLAQDKMLEMISRVY